MRLAIEYGSATPTRNENDGWIMSCSEQPAHSHVGLVDRPECPEPVAREGVRHARESQHLGHHQQHDEAAIGVERDVSGRGLRQRYLRFGYWAEF